jgi:regulatory protein
MPTDKRPPKAPDAAYLERAALHYLERFSASSAHLETVLKRKIMRRCKARGESPEPYYENIAPLIARYTQSNLLNDELFAQAKVASLRRRGTSARMIAAKLAQKGVPAGLTASTLEENETTELEAAKHLVRRKKLGKDESRKDKDMATLARAGFSYGIAKQALEAEEEGC